MSSEQRLKEIEDHLLKLDNERVLLLREIQSIRNDIAVESKSKRTLLGRPLNRKELLTNADKVQLFLQMFAARFDVYPQRWENKKTGKSGYSPACANEWVDPICKKPKVKCTDCSHQNFLSLDELAVESHLKGNSTIGTYAIRADDSCRFLACDFDETSWQQDVLTFQDAASSIGIEAAIERSRSGNGAHAWIFFEEPITAKMARSLGTLILAKCSEQNLRLSLESYDRFFPSQDYLPKGGFGNLIALPLQKTARENGNCSFVNDHFIPHQDQWQYLNQVRRLCLTEIRFILSEYLPKASVSKDGFEDVAWITDNSILEKTSSINSMDPGLVGETIEVILNSMLSISMEKLPSRVIAKLKKTSSFANPEFYKKQRMRMSTYPLTRFIFSGEMRASEIILPRGLLDEVVKILTIAGAQVIIKDQRIDRKKTAFQFSGVLESSQNDAVKSMLKSDAGILMASPGSGKTVMACALIAERKVSTLILVHRQILLDQWKERITTFLGIPAKEIGTLSGSKKKMTGRIDMAMLQSLTRMSDLTEIMESYSQIIIDECHHIPASSFEDILKQIPARYVLGLTATPYRKDGLEKILFQQCGPIRHEFKNQKSLELMKSVTIHETGFQLSAEVKESLPYHMLMHYLTSDVERNKLIARHAIEALADNRFPVLISDRKEHLDVLSLIISETSDISGLEIVRLDGDLTAKKRRLALDKLLELRNKNVKVLLVSSASLIGEGFDLPDLDTLILAMPLSFEGRMIQYAGRIHRRVEGKMEARIIDYVDFSNPVLVRMYRNRLKAYQQMNYSVEEPRKLLGPMAQYALTKSFL
jgi:superfamily II DNA or RNA helicase